MIARSWSGATASEDAPGYLDYLLRTGVKEYRRTPGNRGAHVLRSIDDERARFLLISLWDSMEAVRRFAGEDPERAVFYPEDDRFLVERDERAEHWEVLVEGGVGAIARVWRGWTPPENADAYERLLREEVFPSIGARGIAGYRGVHLLRRELDGEVAFTTILWFDTWAGAREFGAGEGDDYEVAYVPAAARELLARFDRRTAHYEVYVAPGAGAGVQVGATAAPPATGDDAPTA